MLPAPPAKSGHAAALELWEATSVPEPARSRTYRHSLRVMTLASRLAAQFEVSVADVEVAALAHDLGKAVLATELVEKRESLSESDVAVVQAHCYVGYWVCHNRLRRPRAAEYVRDHHERWDGRGYPQGLSGEEISLGGRILALVDVFDTVAFQERPWVQKKPSVYDAVDEISEALGTQFDPNVGESFLELVSTRVHLTSAERLEEIADLILDGRAG